MLPQTNLQLYRVLLDRDADESSLAQVRAAYDLARRLFAGYYRPSHKPFVCHLVGTAGALAEWGQPIDVVMAGLLHSAYMFGDFGDGTRGVSPAKRRVVRDCIGDAAEERVLAYTGQAWQAPLDRLPEALQSAAVDPKNLVIKLADLCDDCADAGPGFSPAKPLEFGMPGNRESRRKVLELAEIVAGAKAREHFSTVLASGDAVHPPAALVSPDQSYHVVVAGGDGPRRSRFRLQLRRLASGLVGKRAS